MRASSLRSLLLALAAVAWGLSSCAAPADEAGARAEEASFVAPAGPLDYYVYVAAESADEIYLIKFDGEQATVEEVIPV